MTWRAVAAELLRAGVPFRDAGMRVDVEANWGRVKLDPGPPGRRYAATGDWLWMGLSAERIEGVEGGADLRSPGQRRGDSLLREKASGGLTPPAHRVSYFRADAGVPHDRTPGAISVPD